MITWVKLNSGDWTCKWRRWAHQSFPPRPMLTMPSKAADKAPGPWMGLLHHLRHLAVVLTMTCYLQGTRATSGKWLQLPQAHTHHIGTGASWSIYRRKTGTVRLFSTSDVGCVPALSCSFLPLRYQDLPTFCFFRETVHSDVFKPTAKKLVWNIVG